jgi:hypothetical protein
MTSDDIVWMESMTVKIGRIWRIASMTVPRSVSLST